MTEWNSIRIELLYSPLNLSKPAKIHPISKRNYLNLQKYIQSVKETICSDNNVIWEKGD
jgi:hypothetical protein